MPRPRTHTITRSNMIFNVGSVQAALMGGLDDAEELRRLLDEAMHALAVQIKETKRMHALATEIVHPKPAR